MATKKVTVKVLGDATQLNQAFKGVNKTVAGVGIAVAAVGAAIVVAMGKATAASLKFSKEFDQGMTQSLAIMDKASRAMRGQMSDAAREMARKTTFSAREAADSYFFLASAGLDAAASIKAMPVVANFAQAGMFDMATATDLLTDAQSALGLTIRNDAVANMENMVRVSDVLVKANTLANASVQQFSESLTNKAATAMRAFGVELEDGISALAAMADQGIKGQLAGNQFAMALTNMTTAAINNRKAFDDLGVKVFDSTGRLFKMHEIVGSLEKAFKGASPEVIKTKLAMLGFADRAQKTILSLIGTSEAMEGYFNATLKAKGISGEIANNQLKSLEAQLGLVESNAIDAGISFGNMMSEGLKPLVSVSLELASGFADFAKSLEDAGEFADSLARKGNTLADAIRGLVRLSGGKGIGVRGKVLGGVSAIAFATPLAIIASRLEFIKGTVGLLAEHGRVGQGGIFGASERFSSRAKGLSGFGGAFGAAGRFKALGAALGGGGDGGAAGGMKETRKAFIDAVKFLDRQIALTLEEQIAGMAPSIPAGTFGGANLFGGSGAGQTLPTAALASMAFVPGSIAPIMTKMPALVTGTEKVKENLIDWGKGLQDAANLALIFGDNLASKVLGAVSSIAGGVQSLGGIFGSQGNGGGLGNISNLLGALPGVGGIIGGAVGIFGSLFGGDNGPSPQEVLEESLPKLEELSNKIDRILNEILAKGVSSLSTIFENMAKTGDITSERLDAMGVVALSVFDELVASGVSYVDALKQIAPALAAAKAAAEEAGVELIGVFAEFAEFSERVGENEGIVSMGEALGDLINALRSTGNMTEDAFGTMQQEIINTIGALRETGFTTEQIAAIMAPALHAAGLAAEELGLSLDGIDPDVLEASKKFTEGLVDPMLAIKDATEAMVLVLAELAEAFGATLPGEVQRYIDKLREAQTLVTSITRNSPTDTTGDKEGAAIGFSSAALPNDTLIQAHEGESVQINPGGGMDGMGGGVIIEAGAIVVNAGQNDAEATAVAVAEQIERRIGQGPRLVGAMRGAL